MKLFFLGLAIFVIAVGCNRTETDTETTIAPPTGTVQTNGSTGMGQTEGAVGGGAQRTGDPEQPQPPSGPR